ncbi:MAG: carboxymuconolactone decarboxylase family protein [Bryobacteraceae bacterium]
MRLPLFVLVLAGVASAQPPATAPSTSNLRLVGDRFKPLTYAEMTPAQKIMTDHLLAGERRGLGGPFNILLRSPEMGDLAAQFGASMRFHSSIPSKLNEMAIIITARYWTAQYEWNAHKRAALAAGFNPAIVDAIATGKRPASLQPDEEAVYTFCTEILTTKHVSDATFAAAKNAVGERGIVDLIGVMGWYQMVSMALNADRYPLGEGVQPELKPLP